ncbi:MAG: hypothetical protein HUJ26_08625 [Planctomycetaceae bacterium]|nr:hypothetical protein [Planctomycetaceae bacterium]
MNHQQKMITLIALVLFIASALYAPWELSDGSNHQDTVEYSTVFRAPQGGSWRARKVSSRVAYTWGGIVLPAAMLVLLASDKRSPNISSES